MKKIIGNKKGGLFMGFIFAFFFFLLGMWMLPFLEDSVTDARVNLQCANPLVSDGTKLTCLFVDAGVPYFIIVILIFIGGLIGNEL